MNEIRSWSKPHTFQSPLHMLSADYLNIDGPPFSVKCVRKFRSTLGGEVTHVCEYAYVHSGGGGVTLAFPAYSGISLAELSSGHY